MIAPDIGDGSPLAQSVWYDDAPQRGVHRLLLYQLVRR